MKRRLKINHTWAASWTPSSPGPAAAAAARVFPVQRLERRRERAVDDRGQRKPHVRRRLVPDERRQAPALPPSPVHRTTGAAPAAVHHPAAPAATRHAARYTAARG